MTTTMMTTTVLDGESDVDVLASIVAVPLTVVVDFFVTFVVTDEDDDVTATGCLVVVVFVVKPPSLSCVVTSGFAVVAG